MIIDTHCHYNLSPLLDEWQRYWQAAQAAKVDGSIVVGTSVATSTQAVELATDVEPFFAAVGVHPTECGRSISLGDSESEVALVLQSVKELASHSKVIAIGECGLDYFRLSADNEEHKQLQKQVLTVQLKIAQELNLPVIIHLRDTGHDAYYDFLSLYKETVTKKLPFVLHCVSGPQDFVAECISMGAYVGVAGNITYPNSSPIRDLVRSVPSDRVLVETDAPFLPPQAARGKICHPEMIQWTVEYITTEFGYTPGSLLENTVAIFPQFKSIYEAYRSS